MPRDPGHWMRRILVLEARKTVALASVGRRSGAEDALARAETALDDAMRELARLGARYPLHMAAEACGLDATDYLLIQLAMLPRVAPREAADLARLLLPDAPDANGPGADRPDDADGPGADRPDDAALRLAHAVAALGRGDDDWDAVEEALREQAVLRQQLVLLGPHDALQPGPALRELLGWD